MAVSCDRPRRLVDLALRLVSTPSFTARRRRGRCTSSRHRPADAVAAGRGRPRERPRHVGGHGRRADADVQRAPRHVVLGPRAVAAGHPRLPARGVRARRPHLRARHLEHEGRSRLLRRGGARAAGRGRAAARRRARSPRSRARSRRRSRATRREPSIAGTRRARATSSRTAASPTCASSASRPRTSSCSRTSARCGCGCRRTGRSSTRPSARDGARRTRSCGCARCSTPCSSGCRVGGARCRTATCAVSRTSARSRAGSAGALADAAPHRPVSGSARAAERADGGRAAQRRSSSRARSTVWTAEVYVTAPGAEIDAEPSTRRRARRGARGGLRRASRSATSRAGSPTRRCSRATGSRPSTTARRRGLPDAELGENLAIDGLVQDGGGVRARGDARVRGRMTPTSTRCRPTCLRRRTTAPRITCSARCCRSSRSTRRRGRCRCASSGASGSFSTSIRAPAGPGARRRRAGTTSPARAAARRSRARSATMRRSWPSSARSSPGSRRRRSTTRSSSRSGTTSRIPSSPTRSCGSARRCGLPTFDVEGVTLYKRITLVVEACAIAKVFYPVFPPDKNADEVVAWLRGARVKLVTFDDGKVGRVDGDAVIELDVPSMREYFERGGARRRPARAACSRGREAARADRPEEVLPHGGQLPRARGGVEARRLVARDRAVDRLLPERRRDRRAGRRRSSIRST